MTDFTPLTKRQIMHRIHKHKPETAYHLMENCGLPLEFIGEGLYRTVYGIVGTPYVVKVPLYQSEGYIDHCRNEWLGEMAIRRNRKWKSLHKYLPDTICFCYNTGVSVMRRYYPIVFRKGVLKEVRSIEAEFMELIKGCDGLDLHEDNFGLDDNGNYVVLDLGCTDREIDFAAA